MGCAATLKYRPIVLVFRRLLQWRAAWFILTAFVVTLLTFQLVLFILSQKSFSDDEIHVAQASLDSILFQQPNNRENVAHAAITGNVNISIDLYWPTKHICGFPVSKENKAGKPDLLGSVILLKGGLLPLKLTPAPNVQPINTSSTRSHEFDACALLFCAKKLIGQLSNADLSRYMTFVEKVFEVKMSLSEKAKLNEPSFCAAWAAGSGSHSSSVAQAYAFVQAFAVGSQLAKVYQLPTSLRITTLTAAQSRMEGLAVLAAMMTHWSGSNETAFNQRLNVVKQWREASMQEETDSEFPLYAIEHPRFCAPTATQPCVCPRLTQIHSLSERYRSLLMASLRSEASNVHAGLLAALGTHPAHFPASLVNPRDVLNPDWPLRAMSALSTTLCNHSLPLLPAPTTTNSSNPVDPGLQLCPNTSEEPVTKDCVPEDLVQRLWKITTYADRLMGDSAAYHQYAVLSSFPLLHRIEQELNASIAKFKELAAGNPPNSPQEVPWLSIYSGQPDSISLIVRALNVSHFSEANRAAGRFAVELYRAVPSAQVRFLIDGEDISTQMPFCPHQVNSTCSVDSFIDFLKHGLWPKEAQNDSATVTSESMFQTTCALSDSRGFWIKPKTRKANSSSGLT